MRNMLVVLILPRSSHKRELMVKERPELFFMTRTTCTCYAPLRSLQLCLQLYTPLGSLYNVHAAWSQDRCSHTFSPASTVCKNSDCGSEGRRQRESSEQVELICQLLQAYNFYTCPGSCIKQTKIDWIFVLYVYLAVVNNICGYNFFSSILRNFYNSSL